MDSGGICPGALARVLREKAEKQSHLFFGGGGGGERREKQSSQTLKAQKQVEDDQFGFP